MEKNDKLKFKKFSVRYAGLFSEHVQSVFRDGAFRFSVRYAGLFSEQAGYHVNEEDKV